MEFINSKKYKKVVDELFSNNENLDMAVAFLGIGAEDFFKKTKKKIRFLCNFESGACNPNLIEKLFKQKNIELKTNPLLHAKIYIQDSSIIIGSANLSANGLSLEGAEQTAWHEVGVLSNNENLIKKSKTWFNDIWNESKDITMGDKNYQKDNWQKRRDRRPTKKDNRENSLIKEALNGHALIDRRIYFAIYNEFATEEATDEFINETNDSENYDFFEDWSNLPDDSYLISIHCDKNEKLTFDGLRRMPEMPFLKKFKLKDGSESEIKICHIVDNIMEFKLTTADKKEIREKFELIKSCAKHHESKPQYNAYTVSLNDWVNALNK
jgi:predicted DNA-binding antitoxin AbrB/MazE fold protein